MNACHQVTQARNAASQAGLALAPDGTGASVGGSSSENCSSPGDSSIGNDPSSTAAVGLPEADVEMAQPTAIEPTSHAAARRAHDPATRLSHRRSYASRSAALTRAAWAAASLATGTRNGEQDT